MNFITACKKGDLKEAEEIFERENIDIHANNGEAFSWANYYNHIGVANWLLYIINEERYFLFIKINANNEDAFCLACLEGDFKGAKEIFERGNIDIHADNEQAFCFACYNGHLKIAKWLLYISEKKGLIYKRSAIASQVDNELRIINIHANNEDALRSACKNGHLHIAEWLLTLYAKKELINLNHPSSKKELENRKKINIELILYLNKRKFKLLDMHAIALIWKEFL